ncbi:hypothetical protein KAM385_31420 [Aeromonas hydrophila]|nr:hypothetical protein KAM385_31420 [Aeromonas hydrophila]
MNLREAKRDISYYLIDYYDGVRINTTMGYRQRKPKNGLTKCPDLVDHYMGDLR